ncbi:MAG: RNB domain-containing ribonuclease, partial [Candidatus Eisenbacteria bacterium]
GDYIIAEVFGDGPAQLVEVLGAEDRPEWDDAAVASQFRLRVHFPPRAQAQADAHHEPGAPERAHRLDLRHLLVFTIDPADARDHDDALHISALPDGRFEVGIHIADVSHYVTPGSPLDDEARARGTSCYLPGAVVPMLPERLSADLCSLREGVDRLALSVICVLGTDATLYEYRFAQSVIRCRVGLSYEQVQDALDGREPLAEDLGVACVQLMGLARSLRRRRLAVGALAIESPEVKAVVDDHGTVIRIVRRPHLASHELVEEFMLLANRCVGEAGAVRGSGVLFRVHEPPLVHKLEALDMMLKVLQLPRLGSIGQPHRALQALLAVPLDPAKKRLVHRLALRSLTRARYLERDLGHFGLATFEYCHFTSPIRRYPDLHNHRRVREWILDRQNQAWDPHANSRLAEQCSGTEQNATEAEREGVRVKGLRHLETRLGERASGSISGLTPRGFFVELEDVPVDGFVRIGDYFDDRFELDPAGVRLEGHRTRRRYTLGDPIDVIIAKVDVPAREADFAPVVQDTRRARRGHGRQGWR